MLEFTGFDKHERGTIPSLLQRSYADYFLVDPACEAGWTQAWAEYDREIFARPDTVGACGFITTVDGVAVGFAAWNPRGFPVGVVGANCVLPEFRGNGYGTHQMQEVLRIFEREGFETVQVTTGEHDFFEPARRMYEACGWREVARGPGDRGSAFGTILYELRCPACSGGQDVNDAP